MIRLFKKHPVLTYYLVTFLISWGGVVLAAGGAAQINAGPRQVPFLPLYFITVAGPLFSTLLLTGLYDGKKGYRELLSRLIKWRVPGRWYSVAIFAAPVSVFTVLFALTLISPVFLPGIFSSGDNPVAIAFGLPGNNKFIFFLFVLGLGLFNGFVEEMGWTGFATPKLLLNHSVIASGLNLGILWGLWHLLSNFIGSAEAAGPVPLQFYLFVMLFSFLPPFRILMMWVYKHTASLLIGILMHASLDVFWIVSMPVAITGEERMTWYIVWAAVLWGLVAIVRFSENKKLLLSTGSA
jgi:membrane protease YdiL (CAAX protease family)